MANPQPTFSSSWHRIADLRPRLRAGVRITRQRFRGRLWYLFHDPSSTSHYRMSRPAYAFAGLLDGRRTIDEAWTIANEQLADEAPTQDEVITVLGQMHGASLLRADLPGDAELLLRRRSRARRRETVGFLMNILFARFRVADPDALLSVLRPVLGPLFSIPALIVWTLFVMLAVSLTAVQWGRVIAEVGQMVTPSNLVLLYAASILGKLFHEIAHGIACKQMARAEGAAESSSGVHAIGLMLLILVPFPYIDASSAWTLRSRWRRVAVGAAGVLCDLALASIAMIVWARTAPDSTLHRFALDLAFVNSVSSVLFNANPLMRFDGYYILTDLIGQPNLYQRSRETLMRLCRVHLFGVREPGTRDADAPLLAAYGLAAAAYRVLITAGIIILISKQWFALALPLAAVALFAFMVAPILKLLAYLANSPQLARVRPRAIGVTFGLALAILVPVGFVPVPDRVRAAGVVEPANPTDIYAEAPGFIVSIADPASRVSADGQPLVRLSNPELKSRVDALEARLRAATLSRRKATGEDPAAALAYAEQEAAIRSQLDDARLRAASLLITSPAAGAWAPANDALRPGAFVDRATPLGRIIDASDLRVRVPIRQTAAGVIAGSGEMVEVRARGAADTPITGARSALIRTDDREASANEPFEVFISLAPDTLLRAGQMVAVRFTAPPKPILTQLFRAARQTLQRASGSTRPADRDQEARPR